MLNIYMLLLSWVVSYLAIDNVLNENIISVLGVMWYVAIYTRISTIILIDCMKNHRRC